MRIRKHLSALHLPAVSNPLFRSDIIAKHGIIFPAAAAAASVGPAKDQREEIGFHQAGNTSPGTPAAAVAATSCAIESQQVGLVEEQEEAKGDILTCSSNSKIMKCRTGVLKVYHKRPDSNSSNDNGCNSSLSSMQKPQQQQDNLLLLDLNTNGAPRTPTALPTRPKRTKPNPFLKSSSFVTSNQQQVESCMLQQKDQMEDISPKATSQPLQVEVRDLEEVPDERKTQPLSGNQQQDGGNRIAEQNEGAKKLSSARQTRSMRNLEELDLNDESLSQCRRMDGKGWRCHRKTQPAYSLCDYHLDKFRETHQRKMKTNAAAAEEPSSRRRYIRRKPVKARSLMSI